MSNPFLNPQLFAPPIPIGSGLTPAAAMGSPFGAAVAPPVGAAPTPFDVPAAATPPLAAPPPMPMPAMPAFTVNRPPAPAAPNFLSMALPMLAATLIGRNDPRAIAEGLAGFMQGRELKRAERETTRQRDERRQQEAAKFYADASQNLSQIDDPMHFSQTLDALGPFLQMHGLSRDMFQFNDQKRLAREKREAADLLKTLDAVHPDGNYTAPWKGGQVPRAQLETLAGLDARDPTTGAVLPRGAAAFKASTPDDLKIAAFARARGKRVEDLTPDEIAQAQNVGKPAKDTAPNAGSFEDYVIRYATQLRKDPAALTPADIEAARKAYNQADDKASSDVTPLTPAALDMAAYTLRVTGTMPTLGMGDKVTRGKILNRAAELTPQDMARIAAGANIPAAKASFAANQDTLKKLRNQRASIGAFETTAQKNVDLFLAQAGKVVDTGSPIANKVVRAVTGQVLGSPDQAAYDAARQVAINEIAKVTNGGGLSGVLSDSARHEIAAFNPQSATLKQTVAVLRLLKQDMANRRSAIDEEIRRTEQTLASPVGASPAAGVGGGRIRARDPQGNIHEAAAGTPLPTDWVLVH